MILFTPPYHINSTTFTVESSIIRTYQSGTPAMSFNQPLQNDSNNDSRLTRIETKIESIEKSMNKVEHGLEKLNDKIDTGLGKLNEKIDSNFKWMLGIFIPLFLTGTATTVLTIIFKH